MWEGEYPNGWEHFEWFQAFIEATKKYQLRLFTAFQEALKVQERALEVRQTAILSEISSEKEYLERLTVNCDLLPWNFPQPRDQATSTKSLIYQMD